MPDPSLIHGRAIPAPELANGTVTVRVVREAIGNNAPGQQVSVTVGGTTRSATTDAQGRAEFTGLPAGGTNAVAEVTVDGEKLVSQPFAVPTSGGLRVILVAGIAKAAERKKQEEAAAAAEPPTKGIVIFGGNTRVLMQFNNDALDVYYILEIVNSARTRVDFGAPLVIELPPGANGATALEGSSKLATVSEDRITITGPLPSGTTMVQAAFRMPYDDANLTLTQKWPAAFQQMIVGVQKVGNLQVASPQLNETNEVRTESGDLFVLGNGPALPAGGTLTLNLSGLPYHSKTPQLRGTGARRRSAGARSLARVQRANSPRRVATGAHRSARHAARPAGSDRIQATIRRRRRGRTGHGVASASSASSNRFTASSMRPTPDRKEAARASRRDERRLRRSFSRRRLPPLRPPARGVAHDVPRVARHDPRAARSQRSREVHAPRDARHAAASDLRQHPLRNARHSAPDRRCARASACWATICSCIRS